MISVKAVRKCFICGEEKEIVLRSAIVRPFWPGQGINGAEITWDYDGDDVAHVGGIACGPCSKKALPGGTEKATKASWLSRLLSWRGIEKNKETR